MKLKNKKVLVTGGAIRIGRSLCIMFANQGAKVVIHYNSSSLEAKQLLTELGGHEQGHQLTKGDLTSQSYLNNLIPSLGKIDILINNASIFDNKPLAIENIAFSKYQYDINFWVPLSLMKQFKEQNSKDGLIINILDQRIYSTCSESGSYLLSKKSLADATRLGALQWAPEIRVNGIAPGIVIPPSTLSKSKMQKSIESTPLKRTTQLKEISNACIFLAENDSITGEIITIDGGRSLLNL